jgi:hypothetical protein
LTSGPHTDRSTLLSTPPRPASPPHCSSTVRDGTSPWRPTTRPSRRLRPTAPARPPPALRR